MGSSFRFLIAFAAIFCCADISGASPRDDSSFVDILTAPPFVPEDAFLLLSDNGNIFRVRAEKLQTAHGLRLAAQVPSTVGNKRLQVGALFVGRGGQYHLEVGHIWTPPRDAGLPSTFQELRDAITTARQEIVKGQETLDDLKRQIDTLERDAEIIGEMSVVRAKENEVSQLKETLAGLERDRADIDLAIQQMRGIAVPVNYARREIELTQRIRELAEAVRQAETGEDARRRASEDSRAHRDELVAIAGGEDPATLEAELRRLRGDFQAQPPLPSPNSQAPSYLDVP